MKLSVCMILKNEGSTIYRCLDSMKTFIDEWIIGIDDTTNDNTESEIKRFFDDNKNCKTDIYKFKWQDNFSQARNDGMDKATGDYILIMDGHEYYPEVWFNITEQKTIKVIFGMKKMKEIVDEDKPDEVFFHLYQQPFINNIPNNYFLQPRMYRNKKEFRFNRAAHNTMMNTNQESHIHFPEIIIIHDAPESNREERKKQRIEINLKNLKKDLDKNKKDTRALFYYGNTHMEARNWDEAIKAYEEYVKYRVDDNSEKCQVFLHKALCYKEKKDYDKMKMSLYHAIKVDPQRRDAYCVLADICYELGEKENALHFYKTALSLKAKSTRMFNNGSVYTWQPHQQLARCYADTNDIPRAIAHLKIAYNYLPNEKWLDQIKEWSRKKRNVLIIDKIGSFTKDFEDSLRKDGFNVINSKEYDHNLALWSDVIWQEWADDNAIYSSKANKKVVIRVHGYEAYLNRNIFNKINWQNTNVVFVAKHIQNMMTKWVNGNGIVIQNGVDIDKYYIKNVNRDNKNIGFAGYMNDKKNPYLLYQIIRDNPDIHFHLRVDWQSPFWEEEFKRANFKNIVYHGRYDNLCDYWNQMAGVISTSIIESFSFNIAEAMACGCRPYIYNWHGAREIWREDWIFETIPVFKNKLNTSDMNEYRKYIVDNYDINNSLRDMKRILLT